MLSWVPGRLARYGVGAAIAICRGQLLGLRQAGGAFTFVATCGRGTGCGQQCLDLRQARCRLGRGVGLVIGSWCGGGRRGHPVRRGRRLNPGGRTDVGGRDDAAAVLERLGQTVGARRRRLSSSLRLEPQLLRKLVDQRAAGLLLCRGCVAQHEKKQGERPHDCLLE